MKLHRDLGVTQKTAWHMQQRIREAFAAQGPKVLFDGPVEVDETYFGGKEYNKHEKDKLKAGRGSVGKTAVVGAKDRNTNHVAARVHTNGVESFRSMLKRAHMGTFHKLSPKHLQRHVDEFAGRHNIRELDTIERMEVTAGGLIGRFLPYRKLVSDNGTSAKAQA